jgi:hypothetical protein
MRVKGHSKCKVPVSAERTQTSGHLDEHMGVSGDELQLCDMRWSLPHCHQRPCILNRAEDNEGPLHAEHNNDMLWYQWVADRLRTLKKHTLDIDISRHIYIHTTLTPLR